jgi:hypothetical protein
MIFQLGIVRTIAILLAIGTMILVSEANASRGELLHKALTESFNDNDRAVDQQKFAQREARSLRNDDNRVVDDYYSEAGVVGLTRYVPEPVLNPEPAD